MADLKTTVAGIQLESPLMLASGVLDENGYTIRRILEEGAAAAVTKSIGVAERPGYQSPVVADVDENTVNAVGLANPGIDSYAGEIAIARKGNKPVIGSIFGSTVDEFVTLGKKMQKFGVDAVELNLSCPHVAHVGSEVGTHPDLVKEIVHSLKKSISIPVLAKLTPNVTDVVEIANAASEADALVLINTVRAMSIDIHAHRPVLSNSVGGLSGPGIKPVGVRCVYDVYKATHKDIIGVGGISSAQDVVEYLMAGARAVQIGTALRNQGRSIFKRINEDLKQFMAEEGYETILDMVGIAVN